MTQARLAERIDMSVSSISQLESGKQDYTQGTLEALADALQCEPGDLLMRNPLDTEAVWTIWDRLKPGQKRQAVELLRVLLDAEAA
jgi:transcriptional regulator with XRE-family HTH domain